MAQCWRVLTTALILFAILAVDARGQRLLEVDGIELRGDAQLVLSGGGTCNVLEADTSYEARKENHGAPMDIWRLDFTVHNDSGRWLDHLIARFQIDSAWPDCTNWDGPDAARFGQPIEWADSAGHIQESGRNVVAPGQTLTETKFFIVLRGAPEPRFENWSMDFDFAAAAPSDDSAGQAGRTAVPAGQLPPEIQLDLHLRKAEQAVRDGDAATAREAMERVASLQAEHGMEPEAEDHFRYAQAWAAAGEPQRAVEATVRYLQLRGREAEHYEEALDLMNRAEGSGQAFRPEPEATCAGKEGGTACWMELSSHPGCYVRAFQFYPDRPLTWSAECSGGLASGTGTLTWVREGSDIEESGLLRNGKPEGRWVERYSQSVEEGASVDGKREGKWTLQWGDEGSGEEWYVNGKRHGRYVSRWSDGSGTEGMYVDGERHGRWMDYSANKEPAGGVYEHGAKQGEWVEHYGYRTRRGPYADGEQHGRWVERDGDIVREGPYVNGWKRGHWVIRDEKDGTTNEGSYVDSGRVGRWVTRRADGTVVKVEEWRHVEERQPDGRVWKGYYVNGEKHGLWSHEGADGELLGEDLYHQGELRRRFY